jgi:hypothetical protein
VVAIDVAVTVTLEHRRAESACHAAPLNKPTAGELELEQFAGVPDEERFTCSACGQPAARAFGDPVTVVASNG